MRLHETSDQTHIASGQETDVSATASNLAYALRYAELGWSIFPLVPGGKDPIVEGGFHRSTTDQEQIKQWWIEHPDAGIGMVPHKSGLCVVDIDTKNGQEGPAQLEMLQAAHGELPTTLQQQSPSSTSGGRHLLFRCEEPLSNTKLAAAIDIRSANGYVVIEPTSLTDGSGYGFVDWDVLTEELPAIATLPAWVIDVQAKNIRETKSAITQDLPPIATKSQDRDVLLTRLECFLNKAPKARVRWHGRPDGLKDTSGSAMDFSMMAMLKIAGFTYLECVTLMLPWPHGSQSAARMHDRYWQRLWSRTATPNEEIPTENLLPEYQYSTKSIKPVEYVLDGFIGTKMTLIAGAPGRGKSTVMVSLASIAAGIMTASDVTAELKRRVYYVTEDAEQVERILYGMMEQGLIRAADYEVEENFKIIHARRRSADEVAKMISLARKLGVTRHPSGYAVEPLVVLDTANATLDLDNENDNSEAGKFISAIKESLGSAALWIVGHTAKSIARADLDNLSFRGAGAFEGDCNAVCYLFTDEKIREKPRILALGKHRFVSTYKEIEISPRYGNVKMSTPWGTVQEVGYCVAIPLRSSLDDREAKHELIKAEHFGKIKRKIMNLVKSANEGGKPLNRTTLRKQVGVKSQTCKELVEELIEEGFLEDYRLDGHKGLLLRILKEPSPEDFLDDVSKLGARCADAILSKRKESAVPETRSP